MINYNFLNSIDFDINVESNYVYNFYNNKESTTDDNVIIDNKISAYSFINLEIDVADKYDDRSFSYGAFINGVVNDIANLSIKQDDGSLHTLTTSEMSLFNKVSDFEKDLLTLNLDISKKDIEVINKNNEIFESEFEAAKNFITQNKKININKNLKNKFFEHNKNNLFFTDSLKNSLEKFDTMFRNSDINLEMSNMSKISENFVPIKTTPVNQYFSQTNSYYYVLTGVLVEKYKVDDDDKDNFTKKDTKFFYIDVLPDGIIENTSNTYRVSKSENIVINDSAVQYGSEYFYVVYPVYAVSLPKKNDYYLVETYLMCDYPYFTNNIVCKEFKRPVSPSNLRFRYINKEKCLNIEWAKPLERQGDIKGYQIFKRKNLNEAYSIVGQIEFLEEDSFYKRNNNVSNSLIEKARFNKTYFDDKEFNTNEIQIYTVCSLDARGQSSNYSEQIAVYYDFYAKKVVVDLVSSAGAPLHMPNLLVPRKTKFYDNEENIVSNTPYEEKISKISLYVTPEYNEIILGESLESDSIISEKYKFSIFKLENNQQIIKDINITL